MRQEHSEPSEASVRETIPPAPKANGHAAEAALSPLAMEELLEALQAMQGGDFSVRLPASRTGIGGKIADPFQLLGHALVGDQSGCLGRNGSLGQHLD